MSTASISPKLEPPSPPGNVDELPWDTELYWTNQELEEHLAPCDTKGEMLNKMLDLIEHLEDVSGELPVNEDAYSNFWMEDAKVFPLFEDTLPALKPEEKTQVQPQLVSYDSTQNLLKEFEYVFDTVNNGAFTPPQSPPYQAPVLTLLEPGTVYTVTPAFNHHQTYQLAVVPEPPPPPTKPDVCNFMPPTPQPDVAHELAVVDELVRTRVENLVPSSPSSSDCSSDDPEWTMESSSDEFKITLKSSRKRSKSNSPFVEEKKSRKKLQNKNAATRYRMKKKAEVEEILGEEKVLQDKNAVLEGNITDLSREIKYLKGLMRDLFKAKGLIE